LRRLAFVGWVVAFAACKHKTATPAPEPSPVPQSSSRVDNGLLGELTREAAQRPQKQPTIETVLSAFEKAGIPIARQQQVLATPIAAKYCVAAASKTGLNMSLCEFGTPDEAKAGMDKSQHVFRALKGRTLVVANCTLLTLMPTQDAPSGGEHELAEKIFRSLTAK
jgi:hypothetical protein